jgi:L-glyceraldehyde 3-phosphate reductase
LAQGILSDRYLHEIPETSRAAKSWGFLKTSELTNELLSRVTRLNALAACRGQSLAGMSLAWLLAKPQVTSVIVGTSSVEQLQENIAALDNCQFESEEITRIEKILI